MISMMIKKVLVALLGMMITVGCSSNDHTDILNPSLILGDWMASHHSTNPNYADTADMWDFTFNSDGTGSGPYVTRSFRYTVNGNRVTLNLMNTEGYYGQTVFVYEIVSLSKDRMEWNETTRDHVLDNSLYLKFYRK